MSLWPFFFFLLSLISLRLFVYLLLVCGRLSNQLCSLRLVLTRLLHACLLSSLHYSVSLSSPFFIHLLDRLYLSHCASPLPSSPLITSHFLPSPSPPVFIFPLALIFPLSSAAFSLFSLHSKGKEIVFNIILLLFLSHGNIVLIALKKGIFYCSTFGLCFVRNSPKWSS